ncbi:MAG: molecular chaperone [Ramlibacter sp.]|nr:molecular chaperone [Ramlibacter sp.]
MLLKLVQLLLACTCAISPVAQAGEFSVNPLRVELGAAVRSAVITLNNSGQDKLSFQLNAMEWSQDSSGKDQYVETTDLVFFPKMMTVEPGQNGLIRVGSKTPLVPSEKTYRLFIEELPGPSKPEASAPDSAGPQIKFLIRFGAPVFVGPAQPQDLLEITELELAKGALKLTAKNTGNRHQVFQGVDLKGLDATGKEVYALTLTDRYLLTGSSKTFTTSIPAAQCGQIASLVAGVKTDKQSVNRKLDVTRAMCP